MLTMLFGLLASQPAVAGEIQGPVREGNQAVGARFGLDGPWTLGLGWAYRLPAQPNLDLTLLGGLDLPLLTDEWTDGRVELGARVEVVRSKGWAVTNQVEVGVLRARTALMVAHTVQLSDTVVAGWLGERAQLAPEVKVEWMPTSHVRVSEAYRELSFADARSGWYAPAGLHFQAGLRGGVGLGHHVSLVGQLGAEWTGRGQAVGFIPVYLNLGTEVQF